MRVWTLFALSILGLALVAAGLWAAASEWFDHAERRHPSRGRRL